MRAPLVASLLCALGLGAVALGVPGFEAARAQDSPSTQAPGHGEVAEGQRVFKQANCMGCHKWHGGGGGGYGGDALSLRATKLDKEQIIQTVSCGRPGTGMPYFERGAYDNPEHPCYGMSRQDLGKDVPLEAPGSFLRPGEIAAVADYVVADIKGKGAPTYADCVAFFGDGSRVCNIYKAAQPGKQGE
jgi:hypothetical protein